MQYHYRHLAHGGHLTMAILHPENRSIIWKTEYPSFVEADNGDLIEDDTLIELGVMKDIEDTHGLCEHLKTSGILQPEDTIEVASYAQGGMPQYDVTDSLLNEFEFRKTSAAAFGSQKWVRRIPKTITDEQLSFIPAQGSEYMTRYANQLIYGLDKLYDTDQKRFIIAGLKTGKLKIVEEGNNYRIIHTSGVQIAAKGAEIPSAGDLKFVNGKAEIKEGRKVIAKIYDRAVFYPAHNIKAGFSHPYSIEITGIGSRECDTLQECIEKINEYKPGGSAGYATGGRIAEEGGEYHIVYFKIRDGVESDDSSTMTVTAMSAEEAEGLLRGILPFNINVVSVTPAVYAKGGQTGFNKLASGIGKKLEGKAVPKKFQKEYGKVYGKKDAQQAGHNIAGSIVNEHKEDKENKPDPSEKLGSLEKEKLTLEKKRMKAIKEDKFSEVESLESQIDKNNSQSDTAIDELRDQAVKQEADVVTSSAREVKSRRDAFIEKYGVTPEALYQKVLTVQKTQEFKSYPYMMVSVAEPAIPGENTEAINQDNHTTFTDMMLCLIETPLLPELKFQIDTYHASDQEHTLLHIPSLSKPAIPSPTDLQESFKTVVANDDLRPAMMGVYYDARHQQLAATNAHILAVKKHKVTGEGKIINISKPFTLNETSGKVIGIKAGDEIPGARFPDYTVVVPDDNVIIIKSVNAKLLYEHLNGICKAGRLFDGHKNNTQLYVTLDTPFGMIIFDPYLLQDLLKFFFRNNVGLLDFEINPKMENGISLKAMLIRDSKNPKDTWGLIMPIQADPSRYHVDLGTLGKVEIAKDYEKRISKSLFRNSYHLSNYEDAVKKGNQWEIDYHGKKLAEENEANEAMAEKFNEILRAQGLKEIKLRQPYKLV